MLILTQPLPTTLEASPLGFLTTDWMGTKSRNSSMFVTMWSVQPLSTSMPAVFHWVRAAQHSSSGVANVGPIATDSCLPPSLCLLHALSRWPFSPHLLHCAVSFLLQSLAKCPGIPHTKQFPFLGPFLKSRFTVSATEPLCPLCLCTVLSWKFCSLFLNSVKFVAGLKLSCITKLSYLIGRPLRTKALKRVSETASPASCSLVSNSCPLMKKLSKSSESSSCSRASCATKVTTVGVSTLWNLSCKSFQAFAPSPMPSSPTQSCLISMRVVASRVSARWHHTLFRFSLMSATSISYASFSTLWFFSSLVAPLASGAGSLGCSSVPSSDL